MSTKPFLDRSEAEDFLYHEAELLDEWRLEEWLALCTEDATYEIPSTTHPHASPQESLYIVHDDRAMLDARIHRLLSRNAHAENPRSRTRRLISNVRVDRAEPNGMPSPSVPEAELRASFHVMRFRNDEVHHYVGRYRYVVRLCDGAVRIAYRRATLDSDSLRPAGGKVSILL